MIARRPFVSLIVTGLLTGAAGAQPEECSEPVAPYVFLILDSSGSMNRAPICSATDLASGVCTTLCPAGDCWLPLDGDDPGSKMFGAKQAIHDAVGASTGAHFGLAIYNNDQLRVRAKHWTYRAEGNGPTVPGWGPFPALGAEEVFGLTWACNSGSGDGAVGCATSTPADLSDPWEVRRVQQLPKGGNPLTTTVTFYLRHAGVPYQVRYQPAISGPMPLPTVQMSVRLERCLNVSCSSRLMIETRTVTFSRQQEFVSWTNLTDRTEPIDFFDAAGTDSLMVNSCNGWEGNSDTSSDAWNTYNLHFPTIADPRGTPLFYGDVIPLDWNDDHRLDIQERMAPNLRLGEPLPDFRIARYLQDSPIGSTGYLRLRNEAARPIVPVGSTPIGATLESVRDWLGGAGGLGWEHIAAAEDPSWPCREKHLVLITDGDDTCFGSPCGAAAALYDQHGFETHVVFFGGDPPPGSQAPCVAFEGGTGAPVVVHHAGELAAALETLFVEIRNP